MRAADDGWAAPRRNRRLGEEHFSVSTVGPLTKPLTLAVSLQSLVLNVGPLAK